MPFQLTPAAMSPLAEAVDGAVVEGQPFRLGLDQLVAHLLQHHLVVGAVLAAFVGDGEEHDVAHFGHDIDLADELWRRIEEDRGGVQIAGIDRLVDRHAGRAPLPRNGVFAAGVERHIDPFRIDVLEILHLVGIGLQQQAFADPDRHDAGRGHDDVETGTALADLGERGVVGIEVGDGDLDLVGLLELLDQVGAGVVAPIVDVELAIGTGDARCTASSDSPTAVAVSFQFMLIAPIVGTVGLPPQVRFLLMKKNAVTMPIDSTRKTVEIALTSGVTVRRSWPSM